MLVTLSSAAGLFAALLSISPTKAIAPADAQMVECAEPSSCDSEPLFAQATEVLVTGTAQRGSLAVGDRQLTSGEYMDDYQFTGRAGQVVTVSATASEFDTYLIMRGPGSFSEENDDAGDGSTNSRLSVTLPTNGTYFIAVTSYRSGEIGQYGVIVEAEGAAALPDAENAQAITSGDTVRAELDAGDERLPSGESVDYYTFSGRAGQRLSVEMSSTTFDTYLAMAGPNGETAANDDAPGRGTDSVLQLNLPADGSYTLAATSYESGMRGPYAVVFSLDDSGAAAQATSATEIQAGQPQRGALAQGDDTLRTGEWQDTYMLQARRGQSFDVSVQSREFNPYLLVRGPGGLSQENDDASPRDTNSALSFAAAADGPIVVVVTSQAPGESGAYAVSVSEGASAPISSVQAIGSGQTARGELTQVSPDGVRFEQRFSFQGNGGQRAQIQVAATDFEATVRVEGPSGFVDEVRDRSRNNQATELSTTLPVNGPYEIVVSSQSTQQRGTFGLTLQLGNATQATQAVGSADGGGALAIGQTTEGRLRRNDLQLTTGEHYDVYTFEGRAGQGVTIEMMSDNIDTYMILRGPNDYGMDNDDGAEGTNSRLEAALPADGQYTILATTYAAGETGPYALSIVEGTSVQRNARGQIYAVLAGITDYPGSNNDLPFCAEDAEKLHESLLASGRLAPESIVLTDGEVTTAALERAFRDVAQAAGPDDVFLFFYSGHGASNAGGREIDGTDESLVLVDGEVTDDEVNRWFGDVDSRMGVIALDSCFSGGFARDVISAPNRMGIFSSEEDVTSNVAARFQAGGYLSFFLRSALEGAADNEPSDGILTAGELTQYLRRQWAANNMVNESTITTDDMAAYQNIVIDRGSVKVDDVLLH
ncbi:MAG: hypothetical protein ACI81R_001325 [Bradymonadia bacterium]|jgi:hypothetical protein